MPFGYVAVYFRKSGQMSSDGSQEHRIEFVPELYDFMVSQAVEFWTEHVERRIHPEITEPDPSTVEYYRRRYRDKDKEIYSDDVIELEVQRLRRWKVLEKRVEEGRKFSEVKLQKEMDKAEIVIDRNTGKKLLTFKGYETTSTDYKGLIAELGIDDELIDKHRKTTQARRFTICKQ